MTNKDSLVELKITIYHEVGHTVVAMVLGKKLRHISLIYNEHDAIYRADSNYDSQTDSEQWVLLVKCLGFAMLPRQNQDGEYKGVRDDCSIALAGWVAEEFLYKQLGISEDEWQPEGSREDYEKVKSLLQVFPPNDQEGEFLNAQAHTREILTNPICWSLVDTLAKKIMNDILQGTKEKQYFGSMCYYFFLPFELYACFQQALLKEPQ